jgi:predicted RND superfamily exporter protein
MISLNEDSTRELFRLITRYPRLLLILSLLLIIGLAAGLSQLVKDTSVKAFIPPDHPSLAADAMVDDVFGISDSLAIALVFDEPDAVFTPGALALIDEVTEALSRMPNVRRERVSSIASESSIRGEDGSVLVEPYVASRDMDTAAARDSLQRWRAMPPHQDSLVSADGSAAVIMAELEDSALASDSYEAALAMAQGFTAPGVELHVAGPGAVSGFLSTYIDRDARKLQPLVFVLVLGFIFLAFRRASSLPGPLLVVIGAAGGAIGLMAWLGIPYYAITNALPVIIVAVSVADSIHILSAYYQARARDPQAEPRELVVTAMTAMARPITLTSLTTVAGFLGIATTSIMPPITMFAWFAATGIALAWLFSMFSLPNVLLLLKPGPSPAFRSWEHDEPSGLGRMLAHLGALSARRYPWVLGIFAVAVVGLALQASQLRIDRSQVDNFAEDEPIFIADRVINDRFAGSGFLDVVIETDEPEGLLSARRMDKIAALQEYFESLPYVGKTVSIADYLAQLHVAMEELPAASAADRPLPAADAAIAQYLLVYESSGDPTDFEEEIDIDYQRALLRGALNEAHFSRTRGTVESLQRYIREEFNEPGMRAMLSGDVNLSYHWMSSLQQSHFRGVLLSVALVLLTSIMVFRSVTSGIVAVLPVSITVLLIYAAMAVFDVYLEPATSMFAAIAIGVGVDFAIHLIDKLHEALKLHDEDIHLAVDHALPLTARACFFNAMALGLGFAVLLSSDLPTLQRFGGLVALASLGSYLSALVLVPALFAFGRDVHQHAFRPRPGVARRAALVTAVLVAGVIYADHSQAREWTGTEVARRIADRPEGDATRRVIDITVTDRRGKTRERSALVLKRNDGEARSTRFTYLAPKSVYEVTFLSRDFHDPERGDDRWLYLPATRKVRRIPASDRGDYFLGTDFTYEDIQLELKLPLSDYDFSDEVSLEGEGASALLRLSGSVKTPEIGRELGYGGFEALVNGEDWLFREVQFRDTDNEPLKTVTVHAVQQDGDIWTATDIEVVNHQTGHQTRFRYREVSYPDDLPVDVFEPAGLMRGLPGSLLP